MPRLRESKIPYQSLRMLFKSYGLNGNKIAPIIGVSPPTAKKKMDNPILFKVGDLDAISRHYGIPIEDIRAAMVR